MALALIGCGGGDLVLPGGAGPAQIVMVDGNQQEAGTGTQVEDSLVVRVVDTAGVGVSGQEVAWTVSLGGGQVQPPTSTTDAN